MSLKYRISTIGWYNFELLVQTLLKAVIGPGVSAFGGSKDAGRDAVFEGLAGFPSPKSTWAGRWVFQVKYLDFEEQGVAAARAALKATFSGELKKLLNRRQRVDNYILLTNVPVTGSGRDDLQKLVSECGFLGNFSLMDGKDVCQLLDIHADVRRSYPQLLGLADLDLIVNKDLYVRSRAFVEQWQPKLSTYVQTEAHRKALALIKKTHFVVLDGPPEAGKSTIAAALALSHVADGFELIDIRNSNDIFSALENRPQIFIADDAVGSLTLDPVRADDWSRDLPGIMRKLDKNHLLIWTARRYILEEALAESRLKEAANDFPGVHEVVVEVGALSQIEKAEILYNHAKQRQLRPEYRALIRDRALGIVSHQDFRPERIRQLTENVLGPSNSLASKPTLGWTEILAFLNNPSERWIQAHGKLSVSEQALLSAMLDFDDLAPTNGLRVSYDSRVSDLGPKCLTFEQSVSRLKHSFLRTGASFAGQEFVTMQHPSLRDMLLLQMREDPIARKRYIGLATPFGLANIIGGIGSVLNSEGDPEHAVVPKNDQEYKLLLARLRGLSEAVLDLRDWELLLGNAERLIPTKAEPSRSETEVTRELRRFGFKPPAERVEPSDLNLEEFLESSRGLIVQSLLQGFASPGTFDNNQRFGSDEWLRLLTRFYNLSAYIVPPINPAFTGVLCETVESDAVESVSLVILIKKFEPIVARQKITSFLTKKLRSFLETEIADLLKQGKNFGEEDDPDQFDYWHKTVGELLDTAREFSQYYGPPTVEGISDLSEVWILSERPREPENAEDYDQEFSDPGPYWTVSRMFEDL